MGTFHRFAARLLRRYARLVGLTSEFSILDPDEAGSLLKRAAQRSGVPLARTPVERVAAVISRAKNDLLTPETFEPRWGRPVDEVARRVWPAYQAMLLEANSADFDDLLGHVARLLVEEPDLRAALDARYRFILVDEYQDTNAVQYCILRGLSIDHPHLAVTGDPDQAIYGWRGASIRNILEFERDYPAATVVKLERNYRSTANILGTADRLIAHNSRRKPKRLLTDAPPGTPVRIVLDASGHDEADRIAGEIAAATAAGTRRPGDFAVLLRTNALSRSLEVALRSRGVPYQLVRGLEFFRRREIRDIVAWLRLVRNPRDDEAVLRVVNVPPRGIGQQSLRRLGAWAEERRIGLLAAAAAAAAVPGVSRRAARALADFAALHAALSAGARDDPRVAAPIEAVLERADGEIARLRRDGRLYGPTSAGPFVAAPLADAPPPPGGVFTAEAEEMLGETGHWGLAVPESHGGSGGSALDLVRAITRLATSVPVAAGTLAVHSTIGAISAVVGFGSAEQSTRLLPGLAAGRPLSIFAATEGDAGCDLARITTVLECHAGRLVLTGTKMFITGATHGRLVKVLASRGGSPVVVLARLPETDTATFRLRRYALHPLKHAHNAALEFQRFEIDPRDVLDPGAGRDPMAIVWHGLNRGRVTLAAQAAGTLRLLLAHAREHAERRVTWGRPIVSRQLVQGRLGRIAAAIAACDALAAWAAAAVDDGQGGEWEAITAKVVASQCVRDAAIDALGVHGGRAFLVGHPLGDSFHDHFAVTVYEGESDLLGLALFKGLARHHPLVASRNAASWRRAGAWLAWRAASVAGTSGRDPTILDRVLRGHALSARRALARLALAIDRAMRRHGTALAERQVEVALLSGAVREATSVLAVAHHADAAGDESLIPPADAWCRLALARAGGRLPAAADLAAAARVPS